VLDRILRAAALGVPHVPRDVAVLDGLLALEPQLRSTDEGFHARPRVRRSHSFARLEQPPAGPGITQQRQIDGLEDLGADDNGVGTQKTANHLLLYRDDEGGLGVIAQVVRASESRQAGQLVLNLHTFLLQHQEPLTEVQVDVRFLFQNVGVRLVKTVAVEGTVF